MTLFFCPGAPEDILYIFKKHLQSHSRYGILQLFQGERQSEECDPRESVSPLKPPCGKSPWNPLSKKFEKSEKSA